MWNRQVSDWGYGFCNWGPFGSGNGFGGWLFHLLIWAAIILAVIWLVRRLIPKTAGQTNDSALELVRKRYAAGEIDQQEFDEMTAKLS